MKKVILLITALTIGCFAETSIVQLQKCMGCHGQNFDKSALNKSKIVKDMNETTIVEALNGYKNGTYGGPMKTLMSSQVKNMSDKDIKNIAKEIKKVK